MNNTTNLTTRINSFNNFYMMSDVSSTYSKWSKEERELKAECNKLDDNQLREVYAGLNENGLESVFGVAIKKHLDTLPQPKPVSKLSRIMSNAWFYFRKGIYTSFSECLKAAWKAFKIIKALKSGVISFSYRKATGAIRQATGTLNASLYTFTGKGVRSESKPDAIKYYDTEKDAWRMFRIERFIEVAS